MPELYQVKRKGQIQIRWIPAWPKLRRLQLGEFIIGQIHKDQTGDPTIAPYQLSFLDLSDHLLKYLHRVIFQFWDLDKADATSPFVQVSNFEKEHKERAVT